MVSPQEGPRHEPLRPQEALAVVMAARDLHAGFSEVYIGQDATEGMKAIGGALLDVVPADPADPSVREAFGLGLVPDPSLPWIPGNLRGWDARFLSFTDNVSEPDSDLAGPELSLHFISPNAADPGRAEVTYTTAGREPGKLAGKKLIIPLGEEPARTVEWQVGEHAPSTEDLSELPEASQADGQAVLADLNEVFDSLFTWAQQNPK